MQWRIQDFPQGGAPTPKIAIIFQIFAENCMKMKEFGPPGGARVPGAPPLDPPMMWSTSFKKKEKKCQSEVDLKFITMLKYVGSFTVLFFKKKAHFCAS